MKLKIGSPVSGDNFYPRPQVVKQLRNALERDHVSFLAPRRTGKTSVLINLEETADDEHPHLRINLETCTRPDQMITALMKPFVEAPAKWKSLLGDAWDRIETLKVGSVSVTSAAKTDTPWEQAAEQLLEALLTHSQPLTFLLDEFPILVDAAANEDHAGCEAMLRWFREWRQRTADTNVRFLVTGSIGLDGVVRKHGFADTVNDFDSVTLPPLGDAEAVDFINCLGKGIGVALTGENAAEMIARLGSAWPYFVQIYVAGIQDSVTDETQIDPEYLAEVYEAHLIAGPRNKYSPHMWDRIDKVFSVQQAAIARAVLLAAANSKAGISGEQVKEAALTAVPQSGEFDDTEFGHTLDVLKHDGYLVQDPFGQQQTRFFTNVLRDYWRRRYA